MRQLISFRWWRWWLSALWPHHASVTTEVRTPEDGVPFVVVHLSHPIQHLALEAEAALELANELLLAAREIEDEVSVGGDEDHPDPPSVVVPSPESTRPH